jgi:hypothetical protein
MSKFIIRQGDVLVIATDKTLPTTPVPAEHGRIILARGEATGHHHSIADRGGVVMFREDGSGGGMYLSVTGSPVALEHQEHTALTIPPGKYAIRIQRTFQAGMSRRVED